MDRASHLTRLTVQLTRLAADADWRGLTQVDRDLANLLPRWSAQQWTHVELAALEQLRRAHEAAREACSRESARVEGLLAHLRTHKDGWMAYAMSNEEQDRA